METYYIEHTEHRVDGASVVSRRYIRDIQYMLWKYFDQVILPDVFFDYMKECFEVYLKKLVGRRNPDFKVTQKYGKEILFLVKTPDGWSSFSSLSVSPISRVTSLKHLEKI